MSTSASTEQLDEETRGLLSKLAKALGKTDAANAGDSDLATQFSALIEEHGDDAVKSLVTAAYAEEIAKETGDSESESDDPVIARLDALEKKIEKLAPAKADPADDLIKQLAKALGAKQTTNSSTAAAGTESKSAQVRDTLAKSGVPIPLIEALTPALESDDENAAAAARQTLAKLGGTVELAELLKESGTTEGNKVTTPELTDAEKASLAAIARGI